MPDFPMVCPGLLCTFFLNQYHGNCTLHTLPTLNYLTTCVLGLQSSAPTKFAGCSSSLPVKNRRLAHWARHLLTLTPQPLLNAAGVKVMQARERLHDLLLLETFQADAALMLLLTSILKTLQGDPFSNVFPAPLFASHAPGEA